MLPTLNSTEEGDKELKDFEKAKRVFNKRQFNYTLPVNEEE